MTGSEYHGMKNNFRTELFVIFVILVSLGFPGNYEEIYGERLGTIMEYSAFLVEIIAMLLSSGENWLDIQLINLDRKYTALYVFGAVIFAESMLVTHYRGLQFITCTRLIVMIFFVIWLVEQFEFERLIELFCIAQVIFIILTLLFTVQHPDYAFSSGSTFIDAFKGLFAAKNTNASELSFGVIITAFLIRQKNRKSERCFWWSIILLVQILLLILCQATGPLLYTIFIMAMFLIPKHIRLPLGWGFISCSVLFLFSMLSLMPAFEWIFELLGKDATLTGRIPLWNQIITVMMDHNTFTGFGYGMFWRDPEAYSLVHAAFDSNSFLGTMTTGAHNALLEYWVNSGIIGIGALFGTILYSTGNMHEIPESKYTFCSLIFVYLMLNGFMERWGYWDIRNMSLFLVMAIGCQASDKQITNERNYVKVIR